MTDVAVQDDFGVLGDDATLTIKRLLPGPVERVWRYLTESDLRRQWLAAGEMGSQVGARFELIWRNDELSDQPGTRPEGFGDEHRLDSEITTFDPPRRLAFTWGSTGGVTLELEPAGNRTLLTVTHRRIEERGSQLNISAGWHAHLDVLAAKLEGESPPPFWDHWAGLKADYDRRITA
jgi:uncharacterized protein YndB with AHSA1/START domain